jgi:hypothetical protein
MKVYECEETCNNRRIEAKEPEVQDGKALIIPHGTRSVRLLLSYDKPLS